MVWWRTGLSLEDLDRWIKMNPLWKPLLGNIQFNRIMIRPGLNWWEICLYYFYFKKFWRCGVYQWYNRSISTKDCTKDRNLYVFLASSKLSCCKAKQRQDKEWQMLSVLMGIYITLVRLKPCFDMCLHEFLPSSMSNDWKWVNKRYLESIPLSLNITLYLWTDVLVKAGWEREAIHN